jgi:hypothetical protein
VPPLGQDEKGGGNSFRGEVPRIVRELEQKKGRVLRKETRRMENPRLSDFFFLRNFPLFSPHSLMRNDIWNVPPSVYLAVH